MPATPPFQLFNQLHFVMSQSRMLAGVVEIGHGDMRRKTESYEGMLKPPKLFRDEVRRVYLGLGGRRVIEGFEDSPAMKRIGVFQCEGNDRSLS